MINVKLEGKEIAKLVCDLFSPLTEVAGAIGDQIRVYRQLSVLRILKRAKTIALKEGLILETPPIKFLVPFLENASLEEENDNVLVDLWTRLLLSASSTHFKSEYNLFIRILNELSSKEAALFQYIVKSDIHKVYKDDIYFLEDVAGNWDDVFTYIKVKELLKSLNINDIKQFNFDEFEEEFRAEHQCPGSFIYFIAIMKGREKQYPVEEFYATPRCDFDDNFESISISMLISLGLIEHYQSPEYWFGNIGIEIKVYYLTPLGASFYNACMGNDSYVN